MQAIVLFYSMYGHIHALSKAFVEGVNQVSGATATLKQVPETLPGEVLEKMGAKEPQKGWAEVPVATADELTDYDLIAVGTPTRFGSACGQVRQYFDSLGKLWAQNALVGKTGAVFTSSATQHGGQESTILSTHITLLHLGLVVVGLPYSFQGQMGVDEIKGCSPYGASTIAGPDMGREVSTTELDGARFQGEHAARIAKKLAS